MGAAVLGAGWAYKALVSGALTLDTGRGRSVRKLGPMQFEYQATREVVFDLISAPYSARPPRALADKVKVLERGSDMVLAAHRTPVRFGLEAVTVETVRFQRPARIDFRLVRGPVPHVMESFSLNERDGRTTLFYEGELGADGWALGRWWGDVVAAKWEAAVSASLESVAREADRRSR